MDNLLAVLGGAIAGGLVSLALENVRWRRAQKVRWHDQRRAVYAEFLSEIHVIFSWWIMSESGLRLLSNIAELKELRDRATSAIAPVNLLAGDDVKVAADNLLSAVMEAIDEGASRMSQAGLMKTQPIDAKTKERLTNGFVEKRTAFERAAREELEIS